MLELKLLLMVLENRLKLVLMVAEKMFLKLVYTWYVEKKIEVGCICLFLGFKVIPTA